MPDDLIYFSEVNEVNREQFIDAKKMAYFDDSVISNLYNHYHRYAAAKRAKLQDSSLTVDVGCGIGEHYRFLTTQEKNESRYVGVDIDRFKLEYFASIHPGIPLIQASGTSLPFADQSVDVLQSLATLEHFDRNDMVKVLDECSRVLKPGGALIVCYPAEGSKLLRFCQLCMHRLIKIKTGYDLEREAIHSHLSTAREIKDILRKRPDLKNVESIYFPLHLPSINLSLFLNEMYLKCGGN